MAGLGSATAPLHGTSANGQRAVELAELGGDQADHRGGGTWTARAGRLGLKGRRPEWRSPRSHRAELGKSILEGLWGRASAYLENVPPDQTLNSPDRKVVEEYTVSFP